MLAHASCEAVHVRIRTLVARVTPHSPHSPHSLQSLPPRRGWGCQREQYSPHPRKQDEQGATIDEEPAARRAAAAAGPPLPRAQARLRGVATVSRPSPRARRVTAHPRHDS
eukprot:COSAG03_NODE_1224_length_4524_cov_116.702825_3_plen_111_part_00